MIALVASTRLAKLGQEVDGFKASPSLYPIVALTAATGMRRGEVLALRWTDFDPVAKTIKIERALEQTKKFGIRVKVPKSWRGVRTVALDDGSVSLLLKHRENASGLIAGVPDGVDVDLGLVRLPEDSLIFPNTNGLGATQPCLNSPNWA
jgi:integrase